jgi:gamma-glutamylcyclotransferase (GGCT)/AIG2-like uncharacterized protein YtfP
MMTADMQLFVVGALATGQKASELIAPYISERKAAKTMGKVYRMPVGYPVIVLEPLNAAGQSDLCWIHGELLTLTAPELVFKLLDEFHGLSALEPTKGVYQRVQRKVIVDEIVLDASIYSLNPEQLPADAEEIPNGDWQRDLSERPSIVNALTDKHSSYLKKLGATKGRQVIVYDLNMSRELMKMGLIVDKGRRLALSRLGKEVIQYLP